MTNQPGEHPSAGGRGRGDFDFWIGSWSQTHRKQRVPVPRGCQDWIEFGSVSHAWSTLGGMGNVDTMEVADMPGVGHFHGMSWRILDPATGEWRIWWASTTRPGLVDHPVVGSFDGPIGVFECDDELQGHPLRVRYTWDATDPDHPTWEQHFSFDGRKTWDLNWVTESTRIVTP